MAATQAPDPRSFKSWEDAFQYPIPVVRKLEQQLRNHATENRDKLRNLVGASYRDLLGTAERIIEMDSEMQKVETKLSLVGQKSNTRVLERVTNNSARLHGPREEERKQRYALASHTAVLQGCASAVSRLLRKKGSPLLAAKLLVLSRLLHKTLSDSTNNHTPFIDTLRDQLATSRRRLLATIDRQLAKPDSETMLESLCAYVLATSSSPSDALRHFHHIRNEAISRHFDTGVGNECLTAIELFLHTVKDTQTLFPRRLSDALARLKTRPLLHDTDIQSIPELNLDIQQRWLAEAIRNFTPWPRHDELSKPDAGRILEAWTGNAVSTIIDGMRTSLEKVEDLDILARLRKDTLMLWLSSSGRLHGGMDVISTLHQFQEAFITRMKAVVHTKANTIDAVCAKVQSYTPQPAASEAASSLWSTLPGQADIENGATTFKTSVSNALAGRDAAVADASTTFETWQRGIEDIQTTIKGMKDIRWDLDLDNDDDDLDLDEELPRLRDDDTDGLRKALEDSISTALTKLKGTFQSAIDKNITSSESTIAEGTDRLSYAKFLLRFLRSITSALPPSSLSTLSPHTIATPLYQCLAEHASAAALERYAVSLTKIYVPRDLWEGTPPLPAQPSTATFRLLYELNKAMAAMGADLWGNTHVLKAHVAGEVAKAIGSVEGESEQMVFEALYLERALSVGDGKILKAVQGKGVEEVVRARLEKVAGEYWKRTYLLFALLAD